MFRDIKDRIFYLYQEKKQPLIITIDEAQYLSNVVLKDLKMLMNFNYDSLNCFTLILCGEPYLNSTLTKPMHESLRQRITVHYNFQGLGPDEIPKYIIRSALPVARIRCWTEPPFPRLRPTAREVRGSSTMS